jgi:glutathione synthase/RimK-type ligase-like ATP-grasp enzyme
MESRGDNMKKLVFLGGLSTDDISTRTPYAEEFSKELPDYQISGLCFDDLLVSFAPGKFSIKDRSGNELKDYDLVIFRGKLRRHLGLAYIISSYLIENKVRSFNEYSLYRPMPKLAQTHLFYQLGLPFIETLFSLDPDRLAEAAESLSYPLILKDNYGAHGENNFLIKNREDLSRRLQNTGAEMLVQKYHQNDSDYRVLVMGDLKPLIIKRTAASGSHLNNTSQGAKAELDNLPKRLLEQSKSLAKELKMTVAGVDILKDKTTGEMLFLEINSQPQLLSGAYVDDKKKLFDDLLNSILD